MEATSAGMWLAWHHEWLLRRSYDAESASTSKLCTNTELDCRYQHLLLNFCAYIIPIVRHIMWYWHNIKHDCARRPTSADGSRFTVRDAGSAPRDRRLNSETQITLRSARTSTSLPAYRNSYFPVSDSSTCCASAKCNKQRYGPPGIYTLYIYIRASPTCNTCGTTDY